MTTTEIATLSTAIIAPILSYLKVREDRIRTADKRDAEIRLLNDRYDMQQVTICELQKKVLGIDEMKESIHEINICLTKIQTLLEVYMKKQDSKDT